MRISPAVLAYLVVFTLFGAERSQAQPANDNGVCSRTARIARTACGHDVMDNYEIEVGRCLNTADAAERGSCLAEAKAARVESTQLCSEQFEARDDLCDRLGDAPYDPSFDPGDFVNPLQIGKNVAPNRFFPLIPGSQWVYRSPSELNTVEVIGRVVRIQGVPCSVVHDVVNQNGQTTEDTLDFFAQRVDGSVVCGEQTQEMENGRVVNVEGSWRAGVDEARPGIIMQAVPRVGDTYRQEFMLGDAEDAAINRSIQRIGDSAGGIVLAHLPGHAREFTALEPDGREEQVLRAEHWSGAGRRPHQWRAFRADSLSDSVTQAATGLTASDRHAHCDFSIYSRESAIENADAAARSGSRAPATGGTNRPLRSSSRNTSRGCFGSHESASAVTMRPPRMSRK